MEILYEQGIILIINRPLVPHKSACCDANGQFLIDKKTNVNISHLLFSFMSLFSYGMQEGIKMVLVSSQHQIWFMTVRHP